MAVLKTKPHEGSVDAFLGAVGNERRRAEGLVIKVLMEKITGLEPKMWGTSIVGFGTYHYKYASGREGDWLVTGFSPRKQALTVYIMNGFGQYKELLSRLGTHKRSKSCLYIPSLEKVDMAVLEELIQLSVAHMAETYPD